MKRKVASRRWWWKKRIPLNELCHVVPTIVFRLEYPAPIVQAINDDEANERTDNENS